MNTGTQAPRRAGNNGRPRLEPTKLLEVIEVGKQLLMTRGALTTFSSPNDVLSTSPSCPRCLHGRVSPRSDRLNVMHLASPSSAILSAVIFNAIIIRSAHPLALRGVKYRPLGAAALVPGAPCSSRAGRDRWRHLLASSSST